VLACDEPTAADQRRADERNDARIWGERVPVTRLRLIDLRAKEIRTPGGLGDRHVVGLAQRPGGGPLAVLT
jgi:hypothetical protein